MGINLGDIAVEDGDFFGDGVNVAAGSRLGGASGSACRVC
jgi:class 3 adenylate cyclase